MNYIESVYFFKNSLLYQMSLGSIELFHWWWLSNNEMSFIKVFLSNFDPLKYNNGEYIWPEREKMNRDIIIWLCDNNVEEYNVIENKIKSLPTLEQLQNYTTNINNNKFKQGVLTGIGDYNLDLSQLDGHSNTHGTWSYVSYEE